MEKVWKTRSSSVHTGDRRCNEGDEFVDRSVRERGMLRLVERRGRK